MLKLRSLNYPRPYGNNAFYFWAFRSEPGTRIAAHIIDLDTEENYDWLEFGNGVDPGQREETKLTRFVKLTLSYLKVNLMQTSKAPLTLDDTVPCQ